MGLPILNVSSNAYDCVQVHGEPVQTMAARVGGKSDTTLAREDIVAFLGGEVAARAAGYTDDVHGNLLNAVQQHSGQSVNFHSLWKPGTFKVIPCQSGDAKSNVSVIDALYPIEDPTKGIAHRGVVREPRRVMRFTDAGVAFDNMFPGGRMGSVLQMGPSEFTIVSSPENAPPINESPWYAFRIHSVAGKQTAITLTLAYESALHRYSPKISYDGKNWQALTLQPGDDTRKGHSASYSLQLDGRTMWVAAQELVTSDRIEDWARTMATAHPYVTLRSAGKSNGGRAFPVLEINKGKTQKPTVIVIGRQHPPEVTGTLAQMRFVEALCDDGTLSAQFLAKFNVVVMPNMNPDGVDQGHWRHNGVGPCSDSNNDGRCDAGKGGVDLNRDWQAFNEPETRAARAVIKSAAKKGVTFFLDFHSTFQDVMYVIQPADPRVTGWMDRLSQREKDYRYTLTPLKRSNPVLPKTSIGWMDNTFGAPVVTYEVGDTTPPDRLGTLARSAAYALMEYLLGN